MPEFIFRTTDMGNFDLNRLLDKLCRAQRRMEMNTDGLLVQTSTPAYTPEVPYYAGRVIQPDKQVDDPLDQMVNSGPGDLVSGNAFAIDTTSGEVIKAHAVRGSHQLALGICESSCAPGGMFTYKSSGATWCLVTPGLTTPPTKGKPMYLGVTPGTVASEAVAGGVIQLLGQFVGSMDPATGKAPAVLQINLRASTR